MALAVYLCFISSGGNGSSSGGNGERLALRQRQMWNMVGSTAGCANPKVLQGYGCHCSLCFALWKTAVIQVWEGHLCPDPMAVGQYLLMLLRFQGEL